MTNIEVALILWIVLSLPLAVLFGRIIALGSAEADAVPYPERDRPSALSRWATKLPVAARAVRGALRLPTHIDAPAPGMTVLTRRGGSIGVIERLVIDLTTGHPAAIVRTTDVDRPSIVVGLGDTARRGGTLLVEDAG